MNDHHRFLHPSANTPNCANPSSPQSCPPDSHLHVLIDYFEILLRITRTALMCLLLSVSGNRQQVGTAAQNGNMGSKSCRIQKSRAKAEGSRKHPAAHCLRYSIWACTVPGSPPWERPEVYLMHTGCRRLEGSCLSAIYRLPGALRNQTSSAGPGRSVRGPCADG